MAAPTSDEDRFAVELEFVQCLGNPRYLQFLAFEGYLQDDAFLNYLRYLEYWREPEYRPYLTFPACLEYLELLHSAEFRASLATESTIARIENQQLLHYAFSHIKRAAPGSDGETRNRAVAQKRLRVFAGVLSEIIDGEMYDMLMGN